MYRQQSLKYLDRLEVYIGDVMGILRIGQITIMYLQGVKDEVQRAYR